jgi:hypothetical protein
MFEGILLNLEMPCHIFARPRIVPRLVISQCCLSLFWEYSSESDYAGFLEDVTFHP